MNCSICGNVLSVQGDELRSYGSPSESASNLGKDIVSLECGHRMHRECILGWFQSTTVMTCPMCRRETAWAPEVIETSSLSSMMNQAWKTLHTSEKRTLSWLWVIVALVSITDPIGFAFVSAVLLMITPPLLYAQVALSLHAVRNVLVGQNSPGVRIAMSVGIATILTAGILYGHEASALS